MRPPIPTDPNSNTRQPASPQPAASLPGTFLQHPVPSPARKALGSFHPASLPPVTRRNYANELKGTALLSVGRAVIEGSVLGIIVKLAYTGFVGEAMLNKAVAVIAAAPAMANVLSFVWSKLSHAKDKSRFLSGLALGMLACAAVLAIAPRNTLGLWLTAAAVSGAWVFWSGFATIRTTIWRQNYPRAVRARITGKLATIQILILGTNGLVLGVLMGDGIARIVRTTGLNDLADRLTLDALGIDPLTVFRFVVIASVAVGIAGALILKGLRVRRHATLLRDERNTDPKQGGPTLNPIGIFQLLLEDRRYGAYQVCQMVLGSANLAVIPLLPIVLADRFNVGYLEGLMLSHVLTVFIMPFFIPVWARFLDRVGVIRFRAFHSWAFVLIMVALLLAVIYENRPLLYTAAILKGIAMAGGMLAWQLGHHDFAPPHRANQYMGVHVSLTGLRGILAPLAAVWLYTALEKTQPGAGVWVFVLGLILTVLGVLCFVALSIAISKGWQQPTDDDEANTLEPAPLTRGQS